MLYNYKKDMAKDDYLVVYTGKLVKGMSAADALKNVAQLFKADEQKVRKVFKGPGAAVVRNLDREKADKYVESLRKAGVVCKAMSVEQYKAAVSSAAKPESPQQGTLPLSGDVASAAPPTSTPQAPEPAEPRPAEQQPTGPRVVNIKLGGTQVIYSPLPATSLASSPGGIDLLQQDTGPLQFEDVLMACAYKALGWSDEKLFLVLFTTRGKRPYLIEADKIFYAEFPEVSGLDLSSSLRSFVRMLATKNPSIVLDTRTRGFVVDGAEPMILENEPLVLTTALARALAPYSGAHAQAAASAPSAPPPRRVDQPESLKAHAAQLRRESEAAVASIGPWATRRCIISGALLALGFALPLVKHSLLYKEDVLLMPWHIMGLALDSRKMAASATLSQAGMKLPWALIPLILAIAAFAITKIAKPRARYASMLLCGSASLFILSAPMYAQHEVLGVLFLPQNFAGGVMFFLFILAAAMIVASARTLDHAPDSKLMRMAAGASGVFMLLGLIVALLALGGTWLSIPMLGLFALMAAFAWHGLMLYRDPDAMLASRAIFIGWALALLTPVAGVIAQTYFADATTASLINSGGGLMNIAISMSKAYLIYFGAAYLMSSGLTALARSALLGRA